MRMGVGLVAAIVGLVPLSSRSEEPSKGDPPKKTEAQAAREVAEAIRLAPAWLPLEVVEKDGGHDVYADECDKSLTWRAELEWVEARRDFSAVPAAKVALRRK